MKRLADDCFEHDEGMIPADEALRRLLSRVDCVVDPVEVPLIEAGGRVLAQDVISSIDVPGHSNAAVDGYAFAATSLAGEGETVLRVVGRSAAGHPFGAACGAGEAVEVLTGAVMPPGADTVVMWEDVSREGESVRIPPGAKPGSNWRPAGEDLGVGARVLPAGHRLRPQDVGLLASVGRAAVPAWGALPVAIGSSGDEIVQPGQSLPPGGVYDVNRFILASLLAPEQGRYAITDLGVVADTREAARAVVSDAAETHAAIIMSGGASKGAEDHIVRAVGELGTLHFWQLLVKPGRPLAFGQIGDTVFVGLPGNPVAATVCFLRFVRPLLAMLSGERFAPPPLFTVPARFAVRKKPGRTEYLRGLLVRGPDGRVHGVSKFPRDGSGILTSLRDADGLIEIGPDVEAVAEGEPVAFLPFSAVGIL